MATGQGKNGESDSEVLKSIPLACADERIAVEFLEALRWHGADTHACPKCGSADVYKVMDRKNPNERNGDFRWRCRSCGQYHTVRTGTVMESTLIPLRHWCRAFWRICSSKKGVSAKQIGRECGLSYKSALFLMHRVRFALADMPGCKLTDTVEVDETYVGGKPRRGGPSGYKTRAKRLQPVMVLVQRGGAASAMVIPNVTGKTLRREIEKGVERSAIINTDDYKGYRWLTYNWPGGHKTVNHSVNEFSRGDAYTNTAECFFSILKRGIFGVFHAVSKKHLHRYVSEFVFRWNTRKTDDGERLVAAVRASEGKRLMYKEPAVA
jgi:transposase-like protein